MHQADRLQQLQHLCQTSRNRKRETEATIHTGLYWTIQGWKNIYFESQFLLFHSNGRLRTCESMDSPCLLSVDQAASCGVMMWGFF